MIQVPMTPAQFDAKCAELKAEQGIDLVGMEEHLEVGRGCDLHL